jgi:hypothetical protein
MSFKMVKLYMVKSSTGSMMINGPDTFALKDTIKRCGGKWFPAISTWEVPATSDLQPLMDELLLLDEARLVAAAKLKAEKKTQRAFDKTPEGQALLREQAAAKAAAAKVAMREQVLRCLAEKAATGAYHWICCEKCTVVDWKRQHTTCWDCGSDDGQGGRNCFRVRGGIYTGD